MYGANFGIVAEMAVCAMQSGVGWWNIPIVWANPRMRRNGVGCTPRDKANASMVMDPLVGTDSAILSS